MLAWCLVELYQIFGLPYAQPAVISNIKLAFLAVLPILGLVGILDQYRHLVSLERWQLGGLVAVPALGLAFSLSNPPAPPDPAGLAYLASSLMPAIPPAAFSLIIMFALPLALFAAFWFIRAQWPQLPAPRRWLLVVSAGLPFLTIPLFSLASGSAGLSATPALLSFSLLGFAAVLTDSTPNPPGGHLIQEEGLINRLSVGILLVDPSGRIVDINETAAMWAGMARQGLIGRPVFEFSRHIGRILLESRRGVALDQDVNLDHFSPPRYCHLRLIEHAWKGEQTIRLLSLEDFSRYVKDQADLRRDRLLLEAALQNHQSGLMVTDPNGRVVLRTDNLLETFHLPERAFDTGLLGWRNQMALEMKDPARFHRFLDQTIQQPIGETLEMLEMANGRWLECRSHPVTPAGGETLYRIWSFTDYTEQTRREQELERLSTHDSLTGAYNRAFFENELRRMRLARRYPISLIVTDVDGLKAINDRSGHPAGDEILRQTAQILDRACRSDDVVARIGGDEVCVLLKHADYQAAEHVIDRIYSLQNLYNIRQPGPGLSLSLGFAVATNPAELDTLFQRADSIMYAARYKKRAGGTRPLG